MKVADIIVRLQNNYQLDDEILISYWDMSYVLDIFDGHEVELTKERWLEVIAETDNYTKHNALSGDLIEEAASDVAIKYEDMEESE